MIIKTAIKLSIVYITIVLSGCDSFKSDSLSHICADFPELCDDLHIIGDCRYKRTTVIRARYYDKTQPTEQHKRHLLSELDEYHSCLELTLFLEFTRNKQRKEKRLDNYLRAATLLKEEVKNSKGTQDPMLAYYLWTHHHDKQAGKVFLAAADKEGVTDTRLLFKLAAVNTRINPQKTLDLFYRALTMSKSLDQIPPSSFVYMMTTFYQHKQFENAYIWAVIAKIEDEKEEYPINFDLILKRGVMSADKSIHNETQLQAQAERYYAQLKVGSFKADAPRLK